MPFSDSYLGLYCFRKCLVTWRHFLSQCWLVISRVFFHSREGKGSKAISLEMFMKVIIIYNALENITFKIKALSPRRWINNQRTGPPTLVDIICIPSLCDCCVMSLTSTMHYEYEIAWWRPWWKTVGQKYSEAQNWQGRWNLNLIYEMAIIKNIVWGKPMRYVVILLWKKQCVVNFSCFNLVTPCY